MDPRKLKMALYLFSPVIVIGGIMSFDGWIMTALLICVLCPLLPIWINLSFIFHCVTCDSPAEYPGDLASIVFLNRCKRCKKGKRL
jgi:hypothetical protein